MIRLAVLAMTALTLTACEFTGAFDGAFSRNLKWFSYIGGEDLRKACGPGADDRFRFVYNGIYEKQIRSYDIHMLPEGKRASMAAFVRAEPDLVERQQDMHPSADPFEATKDGELRDRVQQAIAGLTPDHRAVILLREVEGLSYDEISKVLQCSKGTVMSRLHYARRKLQAELKDFL